MTLSSDKTMDRSEAVDLARWACEQVAIYMTSDGIKILARAVLAMEYD